MRDGSQKPMEQKKELFNPSLYTRVEMGLEEAGGSGAVAGVYPPPAHVLPTVAPWPKAVPHLRVEMRNWFCIAPAADFLNPAPGAHGLGQSFHFLSVQSAPSFGPQTSLLRAKDTH